MVFTEEALIVAVEKHRVLYDLSHRLYYDAKVKDKAWQEVGERLNAEAETCKKRWKALRESFRKSKLRRKTVSGQEPQHQKPWKYEKAMSFLYAGKDQLPNVSPAHEEDTYDGGSVVNDDTQYDGTQYVETQYYDDTETTKFSTQDASSLDSQYGSSVVPSANKRQKNQAITSAEVLQQYLDKKEERRGIRESGQPKNDHIRQFFASSEAIFRMLPAEEQVDARVEITQLLAKYEKQVLLNRVPPPHKPPLPLPQNSESDE